MIYRQKLLLEVYPLIILSIGLVYLLGTLGLGLSSLIGLIRLLEYQAYIISLENDQLVIKFGVINHHTEVVKLSKIQKVRVVRRIIYWPFTSVGDVVVETGNDSNIVLKRIDRYLELHQSLIKDKI